jgi:hypothetical protein
MSKIADVFKCFDYWMKNYNHHGASHSESLRNFITYDSCIIESGVSYDEYVALAFTAKDNKYSIEWLVPYEKFGELVAEAKAMRARMRAEICMQEKSYLDWKAQFASPSDRKTAAYPERVVCILGTIIEVLQEIKRSIGNNNNELTLYPTKPISNEQLLGALEDGIRLAVRTDRSGGSWSYANILVEIFRELDPERFFSLQDWIFANRANTFVPYQCPLEISSYAEYMQYKLAKERFQEEKLACDQEVSRIAREKRQKKAEEHRLRSLENRKQKGFPMPKK